MSVIEQLKDDKEYYSGIGKQYLSNSDIKTLLSDPRNYGKQRKDNPNFLYGRYFHQLILEPEKAKDIPWCDASTRNAAKYKDFLKDNDIDVALTKKEKQEVDELTDIVLNNPKIHDMVHHLDNKFEVPAVSKIKGKQWKGKADIVGNEFIVDLKTTGDIDRFRYSAYSYNYDSQAYLYQKLFGKPLVFIAVCKKSKMIGLYECSDQFLESGEKKVEKAVEQFDMFFGPNPTEDVKEYYRVEIL